MLGAKNQGRERNGTNLRSSHVSCGPCDKSHGECCRLLGLPGDVARNQGEDEVSLRKVELCAIEGD